MPKWPLEELRWDTKNIFLKSKVKIVKQDKNKQHIGQIEKNN